jgi:hypothetical protein
VLAAARLLRERKSLAGEEEGCARLQAWRAQKRTPLAAYVMRVRALQ